MDAHLLRVLAGVSVVFAVACDGRTPPNPISSTPVPSVSPAPTPSATVSGTVLIHDASGVTRRANGWMFGWVQTEREGRTTGQVPTDADGRFRFAVPLGAQVRLQGSTPGAFQPCQVVVRASTDITHDIHMVADRQQLGAHLPAELLARTPVVSGVVDEIVDGRRSPLADVRVELDGLGGLGFVAATTMTDADGRYVLCGLADEPSTYLFASKANYRLFESVVRVNGNTTLDIVMGR